MATFYMKNCSLKQIAESGQCFRWQQLDEKGNKYRIIAGSSLVVAVEQPEENLFTFLCDTDEFDYIWADYFDEGGADYSQIISNVEEKGGLLKDVVASGAVDLDKLKRLDHDTAKLVLKNIHGVGDKVAECISLFGLGKLESYPVDTWVQKIEDYFGRGYIQSEFPDYAGVVQQYLFAYARRYGLPERGDA